MTGRSADRAELREGEATSVDGRARICGGKWVKAGDVGVESGGNRVII